MTSKLLPFLWRGNYHLTPGTGNSGGCITLVNSNLNIIANWEIENRGHILVLQRTGDPGATFIAANIYAPCPNTREKLEFFETVFEKIQELSILHHCDKLIVGGDFNLNFHQREVKNRHYVSRKQW